MPEFPYSEDMYSGGGLDAANGGDSDDEALYAAHAAGLGLGDSSYVPGGGGRGNRRADYQQHHVHHEREQEAPSEEVILSPSDGYFSRSGAAPTSPSHPDASHAHAPRQRQRQRRQEAPTSSQVPHVPNVWVSDPSLAAAQAQGSTAEGKAREARLLEREGRRLFAEGQDRLDGSRSPNPAGALGVGPPPRRPLAAAASPQRRATSSSAFSLLNPQPPSALPPPSPLPYRGATSRTAGTTGSGSAGPSTASSPITTTNTPSSSSAAAAAAAAASFFPLAASRPRRSATIYSERSSLFSEAPPAYTPSPTSPTTGGASSSSSSSSRPLNYQTFGSTPTTTVTTTNPYSHAHNADMGRLSESESHGLLAGQTYQSIPESMGGEPDDNGHFTYPPSDGWRDRLRNHKLVKHWKLLSLAVVLSIATVVFLINAMPGQKDENTITLPGGGSAPVTAPGEKEKTPVQDKDGVNLAYPPFDGQPALGAADVCGTNEIKYSPTKFSLVFAEAQNLSLIQDIQRGSPGGKDVRISGDVVVRRAGSGTPDASIVLETTTNDDRIEIKVDWDWKEQRLRLDTPRAIPWSAAAASPCAHVRATLWLPADAALDSLNVQTVHLGVQLLDNLSLRLRSFARFASTVGAIVGSTDGEKDHNRLMREAPPSTFRLDTRFIEVKTMSSSIAGSWPLYDYLGLETISGSIYAGVQPKEALKDKPLPAILYAHSTSGDLEIRQPVGEVMAAWAAQQAAAASGTTAATTGAGTGAAEAIIPPREYAVDLYSMSGAVRASVAFGHSCKVHTTSGHVDMTLLPVLDQSQLQSAAATRNSFLSTTTTSGITVINVLEAMWIDAPAAKYTAIPSVPPTNNNNINAPPAAPKAPRVAPVGGSDPYDLLRPAARRAESSPLVPRASVQILTPGLPPQPIQPVASTSGGANVNINTNININPSVDSSSTTTTNTGTNGISKPAGQAPPAALRVLTGRHTATSASIQVTYPPSWEGFIDADSLTGKIQVGGEGVEIVRREDSPPGVRKRHIVGRKGALDGKQAGTVRVHTTSGSIGVLVRSS